MTQAVKRTNMQEWEWMVTMSRKITGDM